MIDVLSVDAFNRTLASRTEMEPSPSKSAHINCFFVRKSESMDALKSCLASLTVNCPSLFKSPFTATVTSVMSTGIIYL